MESLLALSTTAGAALRARPALYRELAAGLYSPYAHMIAIMVHDAVWCTIPAILWAVIPFAIAGHSFGDSGSSRGDVLGERFIFLWASQVNAFFAHCAACLA